SRNRGETLAPSPPGASHLETTDEPADYRLIADYLRARGQLVHPVIVSGVSEGAALALLAASEAKNHAWVDGVITMGLPASAELSWRWPYPESWITKRGASEHSFA